MRGGSGGRPSPSTFAGYSFLKKSVPVGAVTALATETLVLLPVAAAALVVLQARGDAALGHGVGRRLQRRIGAEQGP